jgi:hypothetical protein
MSITLSTIRSMYPTYSYHERVGRKQLFVVSASAHPTQPQQLLVSYRTIVGKMGEDGVWILTRHKYSSTTSKQLSQFASGKSVIWQDTEINL